MTGFFGISGITAMTLGAAFSLTAGIALAGDNMSADQIVNACNFSAIHIERKLKLQSLIIGAVARCLWQMYHIGWRERGNRAADSDK